MDYLLIVSSIGASFCYHPCYFAKPLVLTILEMEVRMLSSVQLSAVTYSNYHDFAQERVAMHFEERARTTNTDLSILKELLTPLYSSC